MSQDTFCSHCGEYLAQNVYPKHCNYCFNFIYKNPLPVVVVMMRVERWTFFGAPEMGIILQKRNINPKKGEWALPGGYINEGETWQQAAARELKEEIGLDSDPNKFKLWSVESSTNGDNIIIFCIYEDFVKGFDKIKFEPNEEVQAVDVGWDNKELCFPTHTKCYNDYLNILKED